MVSPDFNTLSEAAPVSDAVIVPAEKLPDVSRCTADLSDPVETTLEELNATLPAFQIILLLTFNSFSSETLNSREPDPVVPLPPSAMIAAL